LQARASGPETTARNAAGIGATELALCNFGLLPENDISEFAAFVRREFL